MRGTKTKIPEYILALTFSVTSNSEAQPNPHPDKHKTSH